MGGSQVRCRSGCSAPPTACWKPLSGQYAIYDCVNGFGNRSDAVRRHDVLEKRLGRGSRSNQGHVRLYMTSILPLSSLANTMAHMSASPRLQASMDGAVLGFCRDV
jgi:hypothetical protein